MRNYRKFLFTGYYQPVIEGSLAPTENYRFPIYGKPADLITAERVTLEPKANIERIVGRARGEQFLPYYSRREIDEDGALRGRGLEIAWVKDPIDVFFLHIQGSGLIRLPDGRQLTRRLCGAKWLAVSQHRTVADRQRQNCQGRDVDAAAAPLSHRESARTRRDLCLQRKLRFLSRAGRRPARQSRSAGHRGRSIATDSRLFPKGALALDPNGNSRHRCTGRLAGWRPIARFMLNQDTGGAIRGLQRADLYFGTGEEPGGTGRIYESAGKNLFS